MLKLQTTLLAPTYKPRTNKNVVTHPAGCSAHYPIFVINCCVNYGNINLDCFKTKQHSIMGKQSPLDKSCQLLLPIQTSVCVTLILPSNCFISLIVYLSIRPSLPIHSSSCLISTHFTGKYVDVLGRTRRQHAPPSQDGLFSESTLRRMGCLVSVLPRTTSTTAHLPADQLMICKTQVRFVPEREK